jgi:hypothetical protein
MRRVVTDAWRPVVAINERGLVPGVDPDGAWQVVDDGQRRGPATGPELDDVAGTTVPAAGGCGGGPGAVRFAPVGCGTSW